MNATNRTRQQEYEIIAAAYDHPFVTIARFGMKDKRLSFKAAGIYDDIDSHGPHWRTWENDLINRHTDGRDSIRAGLQELIDAGYMTRFQLRNPSGRIIRTVLKFYRHYSLNPYVEIRDAKGKRKTIIVKVTDAQMDDPASAIPTEPQTAFPDQAIPAPENPPHSCNSCNSNNTDPVNDQSDNAAVAAPPPPTAPPAAEHKQSQTKTKAPKTPRLSHFTWHDTVHQIVNGAPDLDEKKFDRDGRIPNGQGATPAEVWYETFSLLRPDERLSDIHREQLARNCPDLNRLRAIVLQHHMAGNHKIRNIALIIDWYRDQHRFPAATSAANSTTRPTTVSNHHDQRIKPPAGASLTERYADDILADQRVPELP